VALGTDKTEPSTRRDTIGGLSVAGLAPTSVCTTWRGLIVSRVGHRGQKEPIDETPQTRLKVTNPDNDKSITVEVTGASGSCVLLDDAAFEQVREPGRFLIRRAVVERVG
jgi:hypothetical protein